MTTPDLPPVALPRIGSGVADLPADTDVLVVGLGITGAGVALDAASRGLRVVAVDAHDLAFGTSRWSSKLVHGGLRYLAKGQVGVAHESARERGLLMETIAPHLTRPLPMLLPLLPQVSAVQAAAATAGFVAGDALRLAAGTRRTTLPRPRRLSPTESFTLAPALQRRGLRGGLLSWDGQLEDDARLVIAVARTAAGEGAEIRTRVRVEQATGTSAVLRDAVTGETVTIRARVVINAAGVWAGDLVPEVTLRPSRGTHLVLRGESVPGLRVALTAPVPGTLNRFCFILPQPDGTLYVGLTDEPADGPLPDVPQASDAEVDFLVDVAGRVLARPITRDDVAGTYAGLRPLLAAGGGTADLSRKHAVLVSGTGMVTVVGGKLTTYRRMAEDAVDRALAVAGLAAAPCRTTRLPLVGAAPRPALLEVDAPERLVRRFGTEAPAMLASVRGLTGLSDAELLAPIGAAVPTTLAELVFGASHEGATSVDDLLDRRTRVGLLAAERAMALPAAERALTLVGRTRAET